MREFPIFYNHTEWYLISSPNYVIEMVEESLVKTNCIIILFSHKGSVKGCDSSLVSFCYSPVYFISRVHIFIPATIISTM